MACGVCRGVRVHPSAGPSLSVQIWCHRLAAAGSQGSSRSRRWPGHIPRQALRAKLLLGTRRACELCQSQARHPSQAGRGSGTCATEPCSDMTPLLLFPSQFEMLTGALPFQGKDRKETMTLILK